MTAIESVKSVSMKYRKIHDFFPMNHLIPCFYVGEKIPATFSEQ